MANSDLNYNCTHHRNMSINVDQLHALAIYSHSDGAPEAWVGVWMAVTTIMDLVVGAGIFSAFTGNYA